MHDSDEPIRLNGPMVARLRRCAADTSSDWGGKVTIYPPEARELVALIDVAPELDDLRRLFAMQWDRMAEATERWRSEDPEARALTMPDLGALLRWLMDDADRARGITRPYPSGGADTHA